MPRVECSTVVDLPIAAAWAALRPFNDFSWGTKKSDTPLTIKLNGKAADQVGVVREIELPDGAKIFEPMLSLSDSEHYYEYTITTAPFPVINYHAKLQAFAVTDTNQSLVRWIAEWDAPTVEAGAAVVASITALFSGMLNAFKVNNNQK